MYDEKHCDIILDESTGQLRKQERGGSAIKDDKYYKELGNDGNIKKEDIDTKTENDIENFKETYHVKDSVLVRYYNRKWICYIGFVESIRTSYNITFFHRRDN